MAKSDDNNNKATIEYVNPLAEVSAADQAQQVSALITQRQSSLVQVLAFLEVTKNMPEELRDETTERDLESNEKSAKQLKASIQILRTYKKNLLSGNKEIDE